MHKAIHSYAKVLFFSQQIRESPKKNNDQTILTQHFSLVASATIADNDFNPSIISS